VEAHPLTSSQPPPPLLDLVLNTHRLLC
jgi:hypothetical protein